MFYWIVRKRDDAIQGHVKGVQSIECVSGPFERLENAEEEKKKYKSYGVYYFTIIESDRTPEYTEKEYEFTEAEWEFEDARV